MNKQKTTKNLLSIFITIALSYSIVLALATVSPWDTLTDTMWNDMVTAVNDLTLPSWFTNSNWVIHSTTEKSVATHYTASDTCAGLNSHVCISREYKTAWLWTDFGAGYTWADSQLWWNWSHAHNFTTLCTWVSHTVWSTVQAWTSDSNSYILEDLTACWSRSSRTLKYYCCKG